MSLRKLTEHVFYWQGAVNFGLITAPERNLILIDSGIDSTNARKALRPYLEDGWRLSAIVNTHSHADHIGGNADLVRRTACEVWAPPLEHIFILKPELEPLGLYGGAFPPPGLQVKFIQAQPTPSLRLLGAPPCFAQVSGVNLELVSLPGHSLAQTGVVVEGVFFAADALFKPEVVAKHPVLFLVNVAEYRRSLQIIADRSERYVVPGHGEHIEGTSDLEAVIAFNREHIEKTQRRLLDAIGPKSGEADLVHALATAVGKEHGSDPSYFLDRGAVAAHLSDLAHRGLVTTQFEGGRRYLIRT